LDHAGIFGRSVADVELQLKAVNSDRARSGSQNVPFIGVIRDFFYENAMPEVRTLQDGFLHMLAATPGIHVDEVKLPAAFALQIPILRTILRADVAAIHEELYPLIQWLMDRYFDN
jgi:Asp-tRNA(Asn)/Glu-tRNA(Gln) amidotransferase A subunit family amidase